MKKQGVLIYDDVIGRMDIRFGPLDYYGGLHCGERLEVLLDGEWIPTRIELGELPDISRFKRRMQNLV